MTALAVKRVLLRSVAKGGGGSVPVGYLTYNNHYFIRSQVQVSTVNPLFQDDAQAIQNFVTTVPKIMLVIYNAMAYHGTAEVATAITIQIDGVDQDGIGVRHDQLARGAGNKKDGTTVYYLGLLAAGAHTVKGRFAASWDNVQAVISERQLVIFLFDQNAGGNWGFSSSTTVRTNNTNVFANDPDCSVTLNLPQANMIVLALYSASSIELDAEGVHGKETAIQVDADADRGKHGQSSPLDSPNGCTSHVIYSTLAAGAHTFRGRFRSNQNTVAVSIRNRQLAILVFSPTQLFDQVLDDITVRTYNGVAGVWQDDPPTIINRNLAAQRQTLILYGSYNYTEGALTQTNSGRRSNINVDAANLSEGHQAMNVNHYKCGTSVVHVITLAVGNHTIKGRFTVNVDWDFASVERRTFCVLYF